MNWTFTYDMLITFSITNIMIKDIKYLTVVVISIHSFLLTFALFINIKSSIVHPLI